MTEHTAGPIELDGVVAVVAQYPTQGWLVPSLDPLAVERVMGAIADSEDEQADAKTRHMWWGDDLWITTEHADGSVTWEERVASDEDGLYTLDLQSRVWSPETCIPCADGEHTADVGETCTCCSAMVTE